MSNAPPSPHLTPTAQPAGARAKLARSAVVGIVATVADMVILGALVEGLHVAKAWANVPALSVGLLVQFLGNKFWAFDDRSPALVRQGSLFLLVECGAFALNVGLFHVLGVLAGLPWWLARAASSSAVYFGFSYPLWGYVFRAAPAAKGVRS